jgi:hypothetical protein
LISYRFLIGKLFWSFAMSYLDAPRLHFFGKYFANPSTVNNNLSNYNLIPPLQLSWNPDGLAFFRFLDCHVTSVVKGDGTVLSRGSDDLITQATVTTPQSPPTKVAKIVDLDPDQQSMTQLFGVVVTLALPGGQGAVTGQMAVAELRDLWFQRVAFSSGGDGGASGIWQSVLTDLQWSGLEHSAFLNELYNTSAERLSIKFNCDAYDNNSKSATFNQGRLAGSIGPYLPGEPVQIVMGRRLIPSGGSPYWPAPFQVSRGKNRLVIDFGNSIPLESAGGAVAGPSSLTAIILGPREPVVLPTPLDVSSKAYAVSAGVCEVLITPEQALALETNLLAISAQGYTFPLLQEVTDGLYVNVEPFSLRLNPGESGTVTLYATKFGKPWEGLQLPINFDQQQIDNANSPPAAVSFLTSVMTQHSGQASIKISASTPRPLPDRRSFIDSQVYFLGGAWESLGQISASSGAAISVLVFDNPPPIDNPTWLDVQPVLNQYAVLYPGMNKRIDLSNYEAVFSHSAEILEVISLPIVDPAHMPVTRDLSASHRTLIQTWIKNGCPRGETHA